MIVYVLCIKIERKTKMVIEKIFNRLEMGKMTKRANPVVTFYYPVSPIIYFNFRCPITLYYGYSNKTISLVVIFITPLHPWVHLNEHIYLIIVPFCWQLNMINWYACCLLFQTDKWQNVNCDWFLSMLRTSWHIPLNMITMTSFHQINGHM